MKPSNALIVLAEPQQFGCYLMLPHDHVDRPFDFHSWKKLSKGRKYIFREAFMYKLYPFPFAADEEALFVAE